MCAKWIVSVRTKVCWWFSYTGQVELIESFSLACNSVEISRSTESDNTSEQQGVSPPSWICLTFRCIFPFPVCWIRDCITWCVFDKGQRSSAQNRFIYSQLGKFWQDTIKLGLKHSAQGQAGTPEPFYAGDIRNVNYFVRKRAVKNQRPELNSTQISWQQRQPQWNVLCRQRQDERARTMF